MADNTNEEIYSIGFDPKAFIDGVQQALDNVKKFEDGSGKLEDSMKQLAASVNKVSFTKPITEMNDLREQFRSFIAQGGKLDFSNVSKSIQEATKDIPKMERAISDLKKEMESMDKASKEFAEMEKYVSLVERSLSELKQEAQDTDSKGFVPLRKRLRELRVSMQEMEEAGLSGTEAFEKMRIEAARLTDDLGDQSAVLKALASDTLNIDAGIQALQGVTAAFQLYEGVLGSVGIESEDLQKTQAKLLALMNVAAGIQQIQNLLQKESTIRIVADNAAKVVQAAVTRVVAKTTEEAAAAQVALKAAMASTPWGAVLTVIGVVIGAIIAFTSASGDATDQIDRLNASLDENAKKLKGTLDAISRSTQLDVARLKANGATEVEVFDRTTKGISLSLAEREKAFKKNLEAFEKQKKELTKPIKVAEYKTDAFGNAYVEYVTKNRKISDKERKALKDTEQKLNDEFTEILTERNSLQVRDFERQELLNKKKSDSAKKAAEDQKKIIELESQYAKKLQEIRNRAQDVVESQSPRTEAIIRAKYARELAIEQAENEKTFKALGVAKVKTINDQAAALSKLQADVEVNGFKEEQKKAQEELLRTIRDQQNEIINERIGLIDDEYRRTEQEIAQREAERRQAVEDRFNDTKAAIEAQVKSGVITQQQGDEAIAKAKQISVESVEVIEQDSYQKRIQNTTRFYEQQLSLARQYADLNVSEADKAVAEQILAESERLNKGEINYETYQRNISKIQADANKARLTAAIKAQEAEIALLGDQLSSAQDKDKAAIQTRINNLKKGIADAQTQLNTIGKDVSPTDGLLFKLLGLDPTSADDKKTLDKFKQAANDAIQATIGLLKQQSAAEVAAADAAIEAQQRRVDEAKKIAESGNAEYLQQEEERLRELEIKREQSARKQLQVDAAVQASQILVAVAGAAAQITRGGAVNVATGLASVIAAIASGAALVRSLQSNQPRFFKGTDYVQRGNNPVGRDTVPAMLHEGEAVIQADKNRLYAPTIQAIRRGLVDPTLLNGIATKSIDYNRIGQAVEVHQSTKAAAINLQETNERLARLESVMAMTAQAIQGLGVNVKMDSDGFAAAIHTHLGIKKERRI